MNTSAHTKPFTIAIVGGGIGGIALGIGLAARNVPFHIYESAPSFGEIGAGVTFGPNVIRAIHSLSPAMLRAYAKHVTTNESPELADTFLTYRRGWVPNGEQETRIPAKIFNLVGKVQEIDGMVFPVRCCVHRAKLLDELVKLLPEGSASFNKTFVSFTENEGGLDDGVHLKFADGSAATASAVVGCDGIKSATRKLLHGEDAEPIYAGLFGYRAMVPRDDYEKVMGKELAGTGNLLLYPSGYTIAYPVEHGSALNMFATCAPTGDTWEHKEWRVPSEEGELARACKGLLPGLAELLLKHSSGERWAMFHCPHERPYYQGRVCLLGDAAHATTPHMGAGAGMAIEDAYTLCGLLSSIQAPADIGRAFQAYDAARRTRTQEIIRRSKENVARYMAISSAEGSDLLRLKDESHATYGYLFNFDLDESIRKAVAKL
ncbi:mannitol 1-phosphate dehydrogenase protein [Diaporthe amygdali]|uniref:mannitol 1-phosphate dehydrogenase protein n=1 Tax=Phomopsis amygdali TaxID=1214568 RepID=UPI0022FE6C22|nr:mannitol 1-phosphate dehydrogenase protein [Diaporthe amygdali]KAJ0120658.1 mannitol 1-phosphate dehydrogenase protein [Diaporthe amygdali]